MEVEAAAEEPEAEVLMDLMLEAQQEEQEYLVKYQDLSLLEAAEAAFLAIHALMLDSGAKTAGEIELRDGLARRGCYSARYAVGARGREDTVTCSVRAQPVESRLSVFGTLESDAGSAGVAYATLIQASDYVDEGGSITPEGCRALWAKVKEAMTTKLFEAAKAQLAGILSPGTLMSLPTDVKRRIAENLDAYGLAYCACTCKELRAVCSDDELWTRLFTDGFRRASDANWNFFSLVVQQARDA